MAPKLHSVVGLHSKAHVLGARKHHLFVAHSGIARALIQHQ